MKALVLAGGRGTRLRPITHTSAKQLVPLANTPILFFGLRAIAAAGVTEVGIVVGDTADEVRAAVGDGGAFGLDVTYIEQDEPRGLAHCVLIARDFLGDDPFVMYLGDNFLVGGIDGVVEEFTKERPAAEILLRAVDDPTCFGVAELDATGAVVRLVEKPDDPPSDLALVGVYVFDATVHDAVRAIEPSARGELEITDALQWLVDHGHRVLAHEVHGAWIDTGKKDDLIEANRIVLDLLEDSDVRGDVDDATSVVGHVVVEDGAVLRRSQVRGPAVIGAGTVVEDAYIGPYTAIGADCRIVDAEIEHSIVMDHSSVTGVRRVDHSLIGRDAHVRRATAQPVAYRFTLGDHSAVDVP